MATTRIPTVFPALSMAAILAAVLSCSKVSAPGGPPLPSSAPTAEEAKAFLANANATLLRLNTAGSQAGWVAQNFITEDTEALDSRATRALSDASAKFAKDAVRFDKVDLSPDLRRQLDLLKVSLVLATPSDAKKSEELTQIVSRIRGTYGKGRWCPDPAKPDACHNIDDVTRVLATSRNEPELRREWEGWHTISPPMKKDYARFAELSNEGREGARLRGYRRHVAGEVRHAAGRLLQGARSPLGPGAAAVSRAARLRPDEAASEVRRR